MVKPKTGLFSIRIRLGLGVLSPAAVAIVLLTLSGRFWPDNHSVFILVICLLAILMTFLILRTFTRPITLLTKAAERITLGDLWTQLPLSRDEFGLLTNALNTMTSELRRIETGLETTIAKQASELSSASSQIKTCERQIKGFAEVIHCLANLDPSYEKPEIIFKQVCEIIGKEYGFIQTRLYLIDETGQQAILQASHKTQDNQVADQIPPLSVLVDKLELHSSEPGGLLSRAIRLGEISSQVRNTLSPNPHSGAYSEIVLPLKIASRVIGAIQVQLFESDVNEFLSECDVLAGQVAIAASFFEYARLLREARSSLAEIQTLHRQTLQEAWTAMAVEQKKTGYIYKDGTLSFLAEEANEQPPGESGNPLSESGLQVPITVRGQVIGILNLGESDQGRLWTEEEISLVKIVADQVGLAMENARLLDETLRRAERERLVSEITTRLRASNDPEAILQTAAGELRKALRAARARILMPTEKQ